MGITEQTPPLQPPNNLHISGYPFSTYAQVIFLSVSQTPPPLDIKTRSSAIENLTFQELITTNSQPKEPSSQDLCERCCFSIIRTFKDCGDRIRTVFTNCCCGSSLESNPSP